MKRINNAIYSDMVNTILSKCEEVVDIAYEQYKNAYMLSTSYNYRGPSATACKNYITNITINNIIGLMNVAKELGETLKETRTVFLEYEEDENGIVDTDVLESVDEEIEDTYLSNFNDWATEAEAVLAKASAYITVTKLSYETATTAYENLQNKVSDISDDLTTTDTKACDKLKVVLTHLQNLDKMLDGVEKVIDVQGHIDYTMVEKVITESPFYNEGLDTLEEKLEEDPFSFHASGGSGWEVQGAKGFFAKDVYGYAGASVWTGEAAWKHNNGKYSGNANGSFFQADAGGQLSEYINGEATLSMVHGEGKLNAGFSDEYKGASAEGKVSLANANGKATIGTDKFNGYAKGDATLLGASGYAKAEFSSSTDFALGLGGNLTGASAKASFGFSFLEIKEAKNAPLFKFEATPEGNVGVGADFLIESKKVIDNDVVDINTFHIKLGGKLGLGLTLDVTVPYPSFSFW